MRANEDAIGRAFLVKEPREVAIELLDVVCDDCGVEGWRAQPVHRERGAELRWIRVDGPSDVERERELAHGGIELQVTIAEARHCARSGRQALQIPCERHAIRRLRIGK